MITEKNTNTSKTSGETHVFLDLYFVYHMEKVFAITKYKNLVIPVSQGINKLRNKLSPEICSSG